MEKCDELNFSFFSSPINLTVGWRFNALRGSCNKFGSGSRREGHNKHGLCICSLDYILDFWGFSDESRKSLSPKLHVSRGAQVAGILEHTAAGSHAEAGEKGLVPHLVSRL